MARYAHIPRPEDDNRFLPLKLPKRGEDLIEGRMYEIDPVARAVILDKYGIRVPKFVECIHSKSCARTVTSVTTYADGRPSTTTVMEVPARAETFRCFYKYKKIDFVQCDLDTVDSLRQFYVDAPIAAEDDEEVESTQKVAKDKPAKEKSSRSGISRNDFALLLKDLESI